MRHDQQPRIYAAPEPVLGLVASAVNWEEARARRTARVAMGFAATGAVSSVIVSIGLFAVVSKKHVSGNVEALLGLLLFLTPVLTLLGFILGIVARKTRTGKAAVAVSLTPLGIVAIFILSAFVVGIVAGLK